MPTASSSNTTAHGLWPSPISAALVAAGATPLSQLAVGGVDGRTVLWLAGRASEGGRNTLLCQRFAADADGSAADELTALPYNVRSRVHEYGGGAYTVDGDTLYFSHFADNRLYRVDIHASAPAVAVTPEVPGRRYADFVPDRRHQRLIGVAEQHAQPAADGAHVYPENMLCAIGYDGTSTVLARGHDFYAAPRLSPDGRWLAWLTWDNPRMPWQGTELWLAEVLDGGALTTPRLIAGGAKEAICQPEWSPDGLLYFVSDSSGWWNLYRLADTSIEALWPMAAEFATPHWVFGNSMYGFLSATELVCTYIEDGVSHLARLRLGADGDNHFDEIDTPYQDIRELRVGPDFVAVLAGSPTIALELACIKLDSLERQVLVRSIAALPALAYLSVPDSISYPSTGGRTAHAFFYPPHNADISAPVGAKAPLIVISHGGPTSMTSSTLKLATQFWTSRGFGVLDVNYGGSTGYGREYRDALLGQWGIVDVDDCIAGARHLVACGLADGDRLIIRGGSAGGLTTLCALTFHDVFKVGASHYGVSDLAGLDNDSHKFEAQYLRSLIGPLDVAPAIYQARSPIYHTDKLARPMIFFQGLDDKVVPPPQSEQMVAALRRRGVPVAYVAYEGEGHGFRQAANIIRTLDAELYFYRRIFALVDAEPDAQAPVRIDNLPD